MKTARKDSYFKVQTRDGWQIRKPDGTVLTTAPTEKKAIGWLASLNTHAKAAPDVLREAGGDFVLYEREDVKEYGRTARAVGNMISVVFNCAGDWARFREFTSAKVPLKYLTQVNEIPKDAPNAEIELKYLAKDKTKFKHCTKLITRGVAGSASSIYSRKLFFPVSFKNINSTTYTSEDVVGISVNGNRPDRETFDKALVEAAADAGATFVTDSAKHTQRSYNIGEREVQDFLETLGYVRRDMFVRTVWTPAGTEKGRKL